MAISKKIRFDVFKRDGFACAYCGKTPPSVVLEVDHINPKSKGGKDSIDNLVASCFDCNRGKAGTKLTVMPDTITQKAEILKEKLMQIEEFEKLLKRQDRGLRLKVDAINEIYKSYVKGYELTDNFKKVSLKRFLKALPLSDVEDAMHAACGKRGFRNHGRDAISYFCGICWNKIRGTYDKDK